MEELLPKTEDIIVNYCINFSIYRKLIVFPSYTYRNKNDKYTMEKGILIGILKST